MANLYQNNGGMQGEQSGVNPDIPWGQKRAQLIAQAKAALARGDAQETERALVKVAQQRQMATRRPIAPMVHPLSHLAAPPVKGSGVMSTAEVDRLLEK